VKVARIYAVFGYLLSLLILSGAAHDSVFADIDPRDSSNGRWLLQNYPNPFKEYTVIRFTVPVRGRVVLRVYDLSGKEIITLLDLNNVEEDNYTLHWHIKGLMKGTYFYRIETKAYVAVKKLTILS
jgi:hypothetical protein